MIALSFLGVSDYKETTYSYKNKKIKTKLFPYAFYQFTKPSKLYVIMTQKAKDVHAEELSKVCTFQELMIPDGKTENEIWQMFDLITDVIPANEKVIFDITHGFRSQPIIIIALLLYLRALKNIEIVNILYGAFEAKNERNVAPVFELRSFIDLIDWSNAVHEFIENGNMKYFNNLLSNIHKDSHINPLKTPSRQLKGAGSDLAKLTDAFAAMRLNEIFESSFQFNKRMESLRIDLINNPQAKPFGNLINIIDQKFKPITDAERSVFSDKGIEAQKTILSWYIETDKFQKAITLAREYIVTKYLIEIERIEYTCLLEKICRESAEKKLGKLLSQIKSKKKLNGREKIYGEIWMKLTNARNDINHAGMRKKANPSKSLINTIRLVIQEIINKI